MDEEEFPDRWANVKQKLFTPCLQVLFKATVSRAHILFTLMAAALVKEGDACDMMGNAHRCLFPVRCQETRPSPDKQHEQATLRSLEAAMGAASQGCNATEVHLCISDLLLSMLSLNDEGIAAVDRINAGTMSYVLECVPSAVRKHLEFLDTYFHGAVSETKDSLRPAREEVNQVLAAMAEARTIEPANLAFAVPVVLQVPPPPPPHACIFPHSQSAHAASREHA